MKNLINMFLSETHIFFLIPYLSSPPVVHVAHNYCASQRLGPTATGRCGQNHALAGAPWQSQAWPPEQPPLRAAPASPCLTWEHTERVSAGRAGPLA